MKNIFNAIQLPMGTPSPDNNTPIDLTNTFDVVVFIILPILMIVFYVLWKRSKNRNN